ncbi:ABC transporter substrate-binding protein [Pedobacter puniceum]|uniref:histidine kinase n=1 Tax=Pedobacter puniceum TaxID=2666136 RepID=A0A7K0FPX2_9SPHI|nr:ABC transporter substrate-binding protein [Pedobacter puniceum]MRX48019.1 PAS domain-containing protein [Pedobacter puniceum]
MRFLLAPLILFVFLLKPSYAIKKDTLKLQLKWRHQFQFAGYYAALIKGYYKEEGLNVELIPGGPNISPVQEILKGNADIGVFDPNVVLRNTKEKPLVVLSTIMQSSPYVIISLKRKNILKPSDLIGKTILADQDQGWNIFKAVLLKEGIKSDLIDVIPRKNDSEEIAEGKADAVVTYITTQPQRLQKLGLSVNMIRPVEYGVDFYGDVIFTTKSFAYENPERTDAFIRATLKGWEYAFEHEDELIDYILTLPGVKNYGNNRAFLKIEAQQVKKLVMPDLVQIGHMNIGRWQYMLQIYQQLGIADKKVSLKDFIYNSEDERLNKWLKPIVYAAIAAFIIIVVIVVINWQLRKLVKTKTAELSAEIENRKSAELSAKRNEEKLKLAIKSANIGIWDWDVINKKAFISRDWCEMLGIDYQPSLNKANLLDFVHPDDKIIALKSFKEFKRGNKKRQIFQVRLKLKNGEVLHVMISFTANNYTDKLRNKVSGIVINIDKIRRKEFQLIKVSEELMRSNNELKKFAYITSHNLRAPIVNIEALFGMLNVDTLNPEDLVIVNHIKASIDKLSGVLNDLIEIVSHEIKSEEKCSTNVNIEEVCVRVINSLESKLVKAHAKVKLELDVNTLFYPEKYLESAVFCLLSNAINYKSNHLNLEIHITSQLINNDVVLKVKDNGLGIDLKKNAGKMFGLYQRFHQHTEGRGIGLFILKSHVESLGGSIEVESEPNKGATFILRFPQPESLEM